MGSSQDAKTAAPERAAAEFVSQWNHLISTTNWEKGHIISAWRKVLAAAAAAKPPDYSDEAWSRKVGGVSPQHVGRLRRTYERFSDVQSSYAGLYWSHFQAALDWGDAEMWLEGAVQNRWSVAGMCEHRWNALGAPAELKPRDEDILATEWDEDFTAANESTPAIVRPTQGVVSDLSGSGARDMAKSAGTQADGDQDDLPAATAATTGDRKPLRRAAGPFAGLSPLPEDLNSAMESFKLAILHHKLSGWQDVGRDDVLAALDALKELAVSES